MVVQLFFFRLCFYISYANGKDEIFVFHDWHHQQKQQQNLSHKNRCLSVRAKGNRLHEAVN